MSATRNALHEADLLDFTTWVLKQGHKLTPIDEAHGYEVLRITTDDPFLPIIIYRSEKHAPFLTINGRGAALAQLWLKEKHREWISSRLSRRAARRSA